MLSLPDPGMFLGMLLTSVLVAFSALFALSLATRRSTPQPTSVFAGDTAATVLLFDDDMLVDATPAGRALISDGRAGASPWTRMLAHLEPLFPGLTLRLEGLQREGRFILCGRAEVQPPMMLRAEWLGGLTRLTLLAPEDAGPTAGSGDAAAELALSEELSDLRDTLATAPMPIWRQTAAGEVVWANANYLDAALARLEPGKELSWPLPALFPPQAAVQASGAHPVRLRLGTQVGQGWFDVQAVPAGTDHICYAVPADRLVRAETGLHAFKQTLTRTFADLPIALAIFDSSRVLQMFNPALIDLTGLSAEFLIARPTLSMLLDAMREASMLPEPKDYRSWRRQMVEMEAAAASGLFQDTWGLPSGQTYRVTGRPHPDGALAFLIEDISTEMSRTRRYRADLELGQAVIDAMSDAVVVFAQDGAVAMVNTAARQLWGEEITPGLADAGGEAGAIALFRRLTAPTLLWADLSGYIGSFTPREPWDGDLRLLDGRALECRVSPMPHGSTLISFRCAAAPPAILGAGLGIRTA